MSEASRLARPDLVADFLRERCQRVVGGKVLTSDLQAAFRHWRGLSGPSEQQLFRRLVLLGYHAVRLNGERAWAGLMLLPERRR